MVKRGSDAYHKFQDAFYDHNNLRVSKFSIYEVLFIQDQIH